MPNETLVDSTINVSCPISLRRIDANIVRFISLQVALSAITLLLTQNLYIGMILLFDFSVRTLRLHKISPFYLLSQFIITLLDISPKWCDESPKRFALYLGLVISILVVVLLYIQLNILALIVVAILLLCALFEAIFDFCIGCKIYYLLQLIKGGLHVRNIK